MKVTLEKRAFLSMLEVADKAVNDRSPLPILTCLLLRCESGGMTANGTRHELTIETSTKLETEAEAGCCAIPARPLVALVGALPDGPVVLETEGLLDCPNLVVTTGTAEYHLLGMETGLFPPMPSVAAENTVEIDGKTLTVALGKVCFAASKDATRPQLTGVHFVAAEGVLTLSCAEGGRISIAQLPIDRQARFDMILPMDAAQEVVRGAEGPVLLSATGNKAMFAFGKTRLVSSLIEGRFPDYTKNLPKDWNFKLSVDSDAIASALRRSLVLAAHGVATGFRIGGGEMRVTATSVGTGAGEEWVPVSLEEPESPEPLQLFLEGGRFLEFMSRAGGEVSIEFTTPEGPVICHPGQDWLYVQMPRYE